MFDAIKKQLGENGGVFWFIKVQWRNVTRGWINLINNNEKKTGHPGVQSAVHDSIYDFVLFPG